MGDSRGFTLVEVMIALLVGAITVTAAYGLMRAISDGAARIEVSVDAAQRRAARSDWLTRAFAGTDISDTSVGFAGRRNGAGAESDEIRFRGATARSDRWETSTITIARAANGTLVAVASVATGVGHPGDTLSLADSVAEFRAEYLPTPGASTRWVSEWISPISAPIAVRLEVTFNDGHADTLLFPVGVRG